MQTGRNVVLNFGESSWQLGGLIARLRAVERGTIVVGAVRLPSRQSAQFLRERVKRHVGAALRRLPKPSGHGPNCAGDASAGERDKIVCLSACVGERGGPPH